MPPDSASAPAPAGRQAALAALTASAVGNISGVDFASITFRDTHQRLSTLAATDPLAEQLDALQYELREGPCYAAVTDERMVWVNDVAAAAEFPRFGPRAAELGVGAHTAIRLTHGGERAGLNLYARHAGAFDHSTIEVVELFATHAAALLDYAEQVEQLNEGLHARTDIGTAIGIVMERYGIDRHSAFAFLSRISQSRNITVRLLAHHVIESTQDENGRSEDRPR